MDPIYLDFAHNAVYVDKIFLSENIMVAPSWCLYKPVTSIEKRSSNMRNTRQGFDAPNRVENITMQQIMETMRALQETVAASRMDQERIQIDLAASQARNEELHRTNEELRRNLQQAGERVVDERALPTPPKAFPMPFSQAIMDGVILATFVGPKTAFTSVVYPEAHLTAFHTQMMLSGGSDAVHCTLFMSTLTGTALDWFVSLPDRHVTSFA